MEIRFLIDRETNLPHIYDHNVDEIEVFDVLQRPGLTAGGYDGTLIALGQTRDGRYIKVIYRKTRSGFFVITAYDLSARDLHSYRRRKRRRGL